MTVTGSQQTFIQYRLASYAIGLPNDPEVSRNRVSGTQNKIEIAGRNFKIVLK
jgi:hypothetical protein